MIVSLRVHNLALIEDMSVSFADGMHVLTGETGAGKSIVVDAVSLALGGRADRDLIRTGTDQAWVEAVFDAPDNPEIAKLFAEQQLDYDGRTVALCREISRSGRNLCRVSGVVMPLSFLKQTAGLLMDIHGQHEHQFLMDPAMHQQFLDASGDEAFQSLLRDTEAACGRFLKVHRQYARLVKENEQKNARMALLEISLAELNRAQLQPEEEAALVQERDQAKHGRQISEALSEAGSALGSAAPGEDSVLQRLRAAADALNAIRKLGAPYDGLADRCESASIELQELHYDLTRLMESGAYDPERMEQVEARLDLIRRMERKYGPTLQDVLAEQQRMQAEYDRFSSMDEEVAALGREHRRLLAEYRTKAKSLTEARHVLAQRFTGQLTAQLADLGMEKLQFEVSFLPPPDGKAVMPRPVGDDTIEFMISPNPGEPLKPLSKIASGGELSRIMLAIKSLEAERSGVGTMVFDEIDTGISGRMAQAVAEKMAAIARRRQVICVTHLPQLAAMADHQYLVEKQVEDGRTHTAVRMLDREGRVEELARMLAGAAGSDEGARIHAAHMMEQAAALKAAIRSDGKESV